MSEPGDLLPHSDFSPLSIPHLSTGSGDCALGCWTCALGDSQSAVMLFSPDPHLPLDHPILAGGQPALHLRDCYYSLSAQDSWSSVHF